jgi:hypothetical protein
LNQNWILELFECRIVTAQLGEEKKAVKIARGCLQGGVLSLLLWSLVIDILLTNINNQGYEVIGFVDDLVIMVRGKDQSLISDHLKSALNYATKWYRDSNLKINPRKTIVLPFTRRLKLSLKEPVIDGVTIKLSEDTKY